MLQAIMHQIGCQMQNPKAFVLLLEKFITTLFSYSLILLLYRDRSAGYCYSKIKRDGSQNFVDNWIPYEKPPVSIADQYALRAQQVHLT